MDPDSQPVEDLCATSPSGIRDSPRQDHSAAHVQEEEAAAALGEPSGPQHIQEAEAATPLGELSGSQGIQEDEAAAAPGEPSGSQGVQEDEAAAALGETWGIHAEEAQDDSLESNAPETVQTHDTLTLKQVIQTLTTENQVTFQNFFNGTNRMAAELVNNPNRRSFTPEETLAHVGDLGAIQRIAESLDQYTSRLLEGFLAQAMQLHRVAAAEQDIRRLLDDLTNTHPMALLSAGPKTENPSCAVCVEEYVESDAIVCLQCHISHHFHRACIQKWLETCALVHHHLTCPICRANIEFMEQ
ncbi:hypothetical protein MJO28_012151 [Puccinia striiformis f. sp. tritici]|uniref:RING-type domain-containing protein n=3 Tax=Puccinia striiformis TaxID=27350 RepID=A0A2S4W0P2_9BASI|nr:hypothetical protein MJO28_012151 [Puccinia striiformis f. sp. tritici]POW15216.1 hypothetical protein PSHT_07139 [Puccinia striiformis]POW15321.1 hypothetical protein PSTT_02182 [Puccinia striiformis]